VWQEQEKLEPPPAVQDRGGGSCPRQQSRMPYHIGSRAKIAEIVKGGTTPNSRLIKGDGLQGGRLTPPPI
jgi:hypothetical protein